MLLMETYSFNGDILKLNIDKLLYMRINKYLKYLFKIYKCILI